MVSFVNNVTSFEKAEAEVCIIVITFFCFENELCMFFSIPGPCVGHRNCGVREGT